jgi:hypothetical protein
VVEGVVQDRQMTTVRALAWLYAALSCGVVMFHLAMILGAPWGHLTQGGFHPGVLPLPQRMMAAASAVLTGGMAFVVLSHAGVLAPRGWTRAVMWGVIVMSVLAVVMNLATPSAPERMIWAPVTLVMLGCVIGVFRGAARQRNAASRHGLG